LSAPATPIREEPQARAVSTEEMLQWLEVTGAPTPEYLVNLAEIGRDLIARTGSLYPEWAPADCPTEIVSDLVNERDEARQDAERLRARLASANDLLTVLGDTFDGADVVIRLMDVGGETFARTGDVGVYVLDVVPEDEDEGIGTALERHLAQPDWFVEQKLEILPAGTLTRLHTIKDVNDHASNDLFRWLEQHEPEVLERALSSIAAVRRDGGSLPAGATS
jgi:hypothetical protein